MKNFIVTLICLMIVTVSQAQNLSGIYYIGASGTAPGNTNPDYSTLGEAAAAINAATITGNCTFYFTSNTTETANVGIGKDAAPYTVTFKPYTGTTDTVTLVQTGDNIGASGGLVFGSPDLTISSASNYGLVTTANFIVDGSNTDGGTTRDLVITTKSTIHGNTYPVRLLGDVHDVTIKNLVVTAQQSTSYGLTITNRNSATLGNFTPMNITIDNCEVTNNVGGTAQGISISNSGTATTFPDGIVFKNNIIKAKTRGIFLNYAGNTDVFGNDITVQQTLSGYMSYGIWGFSIGDVSNVTNIVNNKITILATANTAPGDYGITGIEAGSKGIYNINNNMISGFNATASAANPSTKLIGIRCASAAVTANIYFNSIYMPDLAIDPGTGSILYAGAYISNGTVNFRNNIIVSDEKDFASYNIYRSGTNGTLISDYNDLYVSNETNGVVGYWNNADTKTLADWIAAASLDSNSLNADPGFVSVDDLHLSATTSPVVGNGIEIPGYTLDIDGENRDETPEMGADEFEGIIPVELVSFNAGIVDNSVILNWSTATETNNKGFEVERKSESKWLKIGFVSGNGTTTEKQFYSFKDENITANGNIIYRLKQIDLDGTFKYSNETEVELLSPDKFELSQNYPNPFNPATTINFSVPTESKVRLDVFSVTGELVTTLMNEVKEAGSYNIRFNASTLASGTYIYRLTAGSFVVSKKMLLMK